VTHRVPAEWSGLDDHTLAGELAAEAGRLLVAHRDSLVSRGTTHWMLCDTGDALGHDFLTDALRATRPADSVLSEEGADDRTRLANDRVWIVDPLDGTNEYGENRGDWAVHVALWEKGRLAAGAVALPAIDRVFLTDPAPVIPPRPEGNPRLVTSRNRAPYAAVIVANALGCDAFRLGSAGAKAMSIVMNEADIYIHDGGMYQWDSAAPAAVAEAAGLHTSRIDGSPLVYNGREAWLPDFIVCRKELADEVLHALWGDRED
jgi:3'(2'), 5'-bisphosphate nucleotidase